VTDEPNRHDALTPRRYLKGGDALLGGGLLAGCVWTGDSSGANVIDGTFRR
jgi:hypothetical protein